ncbi:YqaA family protein [Pseudomonas sp.]|uniref:YqaA family protein n=1 Tax=Pseudomonas sp. TaxID=306 RepID=UPI003A96BFA4
MWDFSAYPGLFVAAFGAATLLPMQSETVLTSLLLVVATVGNVLGSIINWPLGRYIEHFRHKRWFPVADDKLLGAQRGYHRHGRRSLLLSWAPIIGEPLTVLAGMLREPFWSFLLIVLVAKAGRYLALAALTFGVPG